MSLQPHLLQDPTGHGPASIHAFTRLNTRRGVLGAFQEAVSLGACFLARGCIPSWERSPGRHGAESAQVQLQNPLGLASSSGNWSRS